MAQAKVREYRFQARPMDDGIVGKYPAKNGTKREIRKEGDYWVVRWTVSPTPTDAERRKAMKANG